MVDCVFRHKDTINHKVRDLPEKNPRILPALLPVFFVATPGKTIGASCSGISGSTCLFKAGLMFSTYTGFNFSLWFKTAKSWACRKKHENKR